jgi:hypothetical protein
VEEFESDSCSILLLFGLVSVKLIRQQRAVSRHLLWPASHIARFISRHARTGKMMMNSTANLLSGPDRPAFSPVCAGIQGVPPDI